jgi:cytochrome d ubiquinol oxidase subunit II
MANNFYANAVAILIFGGLTAYALFAGADFGAGLWDLFAMGEEEQRQRGAIIRAIGPVWEANNIWLIFIITGTFTAFPEVFSTLSEALFVPLALALIGVVLRGAGFAYYSHFRQAVQVNLIWGTAFSGASLIAPFLFGTAAAAIASGAIHVLNGQVDANIWTSWTTPFAISVGLFAVAICACLAATYLAVEASKEQTPAILDIFHQRALIAYGGIAVMGLIAGLLARSEAPALWGELTTRALPVVLAAMLLGALSAVLQWRRQFWWARLCIIASVTAILGAWAIAQLPYLIYPDVTISSAASVPHVMEAVFWAALIGLAIVIPALSLLLRVFKGEPLAHGGSANDLIQSLPEPKDEAS